MSQRRAGHVNRCTNCRVNNHFCACHALTPTTITNKVSLIVHVSELRLTSNTAQFVEKILPQSAEIFIRGRVNDTFSGDPILAREGRPLFLFPSEDSLELNDEFLKSNPGPYNLIVPDGNWNQAKKVKTREAKFHDIQAVRLPSGLVGEYKLRKAPQPEWVSTYEAVAYALGVLEGKPIQEHMLAFFRTWVQATLNSRTGNFKLGSQFLNQE
jgi:DTW domain-containing protein YfiP